MTRDELLALAQGFRASSRNYSGAFDVSFTAAGLEAFAAALSARPKEAAPSEEQWKELFWQVALALKCLPSSYLDGNEHVLRQAKKFAAIAATQAPQEGENGE